MNYWDFCGGPVDKNPLSSVEHSDLIPGLGTKIPHEAKHICCNYSEPGSTSARRPMQPNK